MRQFLEMQLSVKNKKSVLGRDNLMRPKPSSQEKKKFEEERARRILMYLFPDEYENTILSESPDIISFDKDIGVEVTNGLASHVQEALSRACDITGKTDGELTEINRRNIEMRGITAKPLSGKYIAGVAIWGDQYDIEGAYKKKLIKLNTSHFTRCNKNNLFIIAMLMDDDELYSGINKIIALDKSLYNILFDNVYIFTQNYIIVINVATDNICKYSIRAEVLSQISESTFITIMGMSKNEYYKKE